MKKNKINDICFKLYAPHLCPEPVTESKTALENKLLTEMMYLGGKILKIRKKKNNDYCDFYEDEKSELIYMALAACINKWRTKEITTEENFSAYFSTVLKNENFRIIEKEKKQCCSSLDKPVGEDEDTDEDTIKDFIKDENSVTPDEAYIEKESIKNRLKTIDICWKQAEFPDWYNSVITCESYEVLHEIFCRYEMNPERYSFIDMEIYNMNEKPKQKDIAQMIDKDQAQLSRALRSIRKKLQSLGLKSPL